MNDVIASYFDAWNEPDPARRRRLLERSVTSDVELVHPSGIYRGINELDEQIDRYQAARPGSEAVIASDIDAHNNVERYAWRILDKQGHELMNGIDIAEHAEDGRLTRILLFHGPLPPIAAAPHRPPTADADPTP